MMLPENLRVIKRARRIFAGLAALLAFNALSIAADDHLKDCSSNQLEATKRIVACTNVIGDKAASPIDQAIAYLNRAIALVGTGEQDRAMSDYSKAIDLDPNNASAYRRRAEVWIRKGDNNHAIADYDQAIRIDPADASTYRDRADAWAGKTFYKRAIAEYDQAIRLDPKNALSATTIAVCSGHMRVMRTGLLPTSTRRSALIRITPMLSTIEAWLGRRRATSTKP